MNHNDLFRSAISGLLAMGAIATVSAASADEQEEQCAGSSGCQLRPNSDYSATAHLARGNRLTTVRRHRGRKRLPHEPQNKSALCGVAGPLIGTSVFP